MVGTHENEKICVIFESQEDIVNFVNICNKYNDDIDIINKRMYIDAKSIMGMISLELGHPYEVLYECYDDDDNYEAFKKDILSEFSEKITIEAVESKSQDLNME